MADFEFNPETFDDRKNFFRAACALSRADEAAKRTDRFSGAIFRRRLRAEASAIAGLEGHSVRPEALCRLIGDPDASHLDRGSKLAADLYKALEFSSKWEASVPDADTVLELFTLSDASSGRLMRPDLLWTLQDDSAWLVEEMASLAESPDPWAAVEVVRRIWMSGRFQSCARRMSMLVAPWLLAKGFGLHEHPYGMAQRVRANIESFKDVGRLQDAWSMVAAAALAEAGDADIKLIDDHKAERAALLAICPPERSTSSIAAAVDFVMGTPVFTNKIMSEALDLSLRGVKVVTDKMEDAGLLEVFGNKHNRTFLCRRTL